MLNSKIFIEYLRKKKERIDSQNVEKKEHYNRRKNSFRKFKLKNLIEDIASYSEDNTKDKDRSSSIMKEFTRELNLSIVLFFLI